MVFANGTGTDINMDHHRLFPYGTLWSNIQLGAGRWTCACSEQCVLYRVYHPLLVPHLQTLATAHNYEHELPSVQPNTCLLPCSAGSRPFLAGGESAWGAYSASYGTFWNIRANAGRPLDFSNTPQQWGARLNFVGLTFGDSWPAVGGLCCCACPCAC